MCNVSGPDYPIPSRYLIHIIPIAFIYLLLQAGSVSLFVSEDTVALSKNYVDININIVSASQFRKAETLSTEVLSNSLEQNPYAIITNLHGVTVGQLVGDGVILKFTYPVTTSKKRAGINFELREN